MSQPSLAKTRTMVRQHGVHWNPSELLTTKRAKANIKPRAVNDSDGRPILTQLKGRLLTIAQYLPTGMTNAQLAKLLNTSESVVKNQVRSLLEKFGCASRLELANELARQGWNGEVIKKVYSCETPGSPKKPKRATNHRVIKSGEILKNEKGLRRRILKRIPLGEKYRVIAQHVGTTEELVKQYVYTTNMKYGYADKLELTNALIAEGWKHPDGKSRESKPMEMGGLDVTS